MLIFIYAMLYAMAFIYGACIASFANAYAWRYKEGSSVLKGRSACPGCGTTIKGYDLVPIISYLFLNGKCRACKRHISLRYPVTEVLGGLACVLCFYRFGFLVETLITAALGLVLLAIAIVDIDTQEIPNGAVVLIGLLGIVSMAQGTLPLIERVLGMLCISLGFCAMNLIYSDSFGGGDIKLMAAAGFLLGWKCTMLAGFIGMVLGGAYGIYLLSSKKAGKGVHIAFGPYLATGIFIAALWGNNIISWYTSLLGF